MLAENEVQASVEQARPTFPRYRNWLYNNEKSREYTGFFLWGEFDVIDDKSPGADMATKNFHHVSTAACTERVQ